MTSVALVSIRLDGGTQSRAAIDAAVVADYADAIESLPAITLFFDGDDHWLADGFHRYRAHEAKGLREINATVKQGTRRDAVLYSVGANSSHGLRRTNADKRRAVEVLLADEEWSAKSDRWIAERCGVGHPFVATMRPQLESDSSSSRIGQDGKTRKLPQREPAQRREPASPSPAPSRDPYADVASESPRDDWNPRAEALSVDAVISSVFYAWPGDEDMAPLRGILAQWLTKIEKRDSK